MFMTRLRDDRGFTMVELLVSSVVTVIVLGGAVALTSQIQNGYRRQIEDSAAEQEGRYALDWIGRSIRGADNNPTGATTTNCPDTAADPAPMNIAGIRFDPNGDGVDNDIRLMTDSNPADGWVGGQSAPNCNQANEDVTISLDDETNTIVFLDNNTGGAVTTRTDTVIEDLRFVYYDSLHNTPPANAASVFYVETQITIRTRTIDAASGAPMTRTLSSEVRVRSR